MRPASNRPGSLACSSLLLAALGCTDPGSSGTDSADEASGGETVASSESSETLAGSESSETVAGSESSMDSSESGGLPCSYPAGAAEPMTLGEVLVPYSWTTAIHADGTTTSLDLLDVPCATDEVIDWSIHELLVFISLPAW
jgi:hypothetical protein